MFTIYDTKTGKPFTVQHLIDAKEAVRNGSYTFTPPAPPAPVAVESKPVVKKVEPVIPKVEEPKVEAEVPVVPEEEDKKEDDSSTRPKRVLRKR